MTPESINGQSLMRVVQAALRPMLYPHGRGKGTAHPEIEDLLAEGYLAAWQQVSRMTEDTPWQWTTIAWQAARTRVWDRIRRAKPMPISIEHDEEKDHDEEGEGEGWLAIDESGFRAAEARIFIESLAPRLTPCQQEAIELIYYQGLTITEASQQLGIAWQTMQSRHKGALKKYRRQVER